MRCLWTVFLTLLVTSSVLATELTGPIVGVLDGDTIEVLNGHHVDRIRLNGIDCPERGQAYGQKTKHAASELAVGKQFRLQTHGKDKYGRTLADVLLPDGTNVNHTLVKDGWCWWYRKYAPGDRMLGGLGNVPVPDGFDGLIEVRWWGGINKGPTPFGAGPFQIPPWSHCMRMRRRMCMHRASISVSQPPLPLRHPRPRAY